MCLHSVAQPHVLLYGILVALISLNESRIGHDLRLRRLSKQGFIEPLRRLGHDGEPELTFRQLVYDRVNSRHIEIVREAQHCGVAARVPHIRDEGEWMDRLALPIEVKRHIRLQVTCNRLRVLSPRFH